MNGNETLPDHTGEGCGMTERLHERWGTGFLLFKLLVFTFFVPGTVTVWLPLYFAFPEVRHRGIEWNAAAGAAILLALGVSGYLWCALDFAFAGRGTPAPIDPPKVVVVRGLYRFTRNPMYISVLFVLLGEALLFRSAALLEYAAVFAVGFHLFVLLYEEPTLRKKRKSGHNPNGAAALPVDVICARRARGAP